MHELNEKHIGCPYCGETIPVLIDASVEEQQYVEDCQVCCRPIVFIVSVNSDDEISVHVRTDNE